MILIPVFDMILIAVFDMILIAVFDTILIVIFILSNNAGKTTGILRSPCCYFQPASESTHALLASLSR